MTKTKSTKGTPVSNDDKIKLLLAKVEEQQANLGTRPKAHYESNGSFQYKDGRGHFNLNTVTNFRVFVDALAFLLDSKGLQDQAAERLDVKPEPFAWDGSTIEEWEQDFKTRIAIVEWQSRKKKLAATKKKLNTLVSEEARTEMELTDIEKLLA